MKKNVCILTKSLKDREFCVAGIDISNGQWIRLVSTKDGGVFPKELLDDANINVLDIVEVDFIKKVPLKVQQENWLVNTNIKLKKISTWSIGNVKKIHKTDNPERIFYNTSSSLTEDDIKNIDHSLEMVNVKNLEFDVYDKGDERPHFRVHFEYNSNKYTLCLTDPEYRDEDYNKIKIPSSTLIISLPAYPYGDNQTYGKFVAKIFI